MKNTNASPIIFGWDFQINAAIILFLENIKEVKSIRVEGMIEDIEITLNNGKSIYSQSKAVERENDYTNVLKKLKEAIITLDAACKQVNCEKIIYITNTPNPFSNQRTMSSFSGPISRRTFDELPESCQKTLLTATAKMGLGSFDVEKFEVRVFPFFTSNPYERYKIIKSEIESLLYKLNVRGLSEQLMELWQQEFFFNASQNPRDLQLSKKELIWPVVVFESAVMENDELLEDYDAADVEEIIRNYRGFIDNRVERFEFSVKIISDFREYPFEGGSREKVRNFVEDKWLEYYKEFDISKISNETCEILTKIIIHKVLRNRYLINNIRKEVGL